VLVPYFWYLAYALVDQRSKDRSSDLFQLGAFHPVWGGASSIPIGKGAAFLRKMLAKNPEEMAITQIKGVKLLLWADALLALKILLKWFFEDYCQIPSVTDAIDASIHHQSYSWGMQWASLLWSVTSYSLRIAISGHFIIGSARLAGFRLPRSTWRPLESRTLIEYFNRFHYYFKELLVDFFFLPTFFRVFKEHPRLRLFFATFMAAGVGNAIYHFMSEIDLIESMGFVGALESYISYAFYCVILATGIGISQVRVNMGYKPSNSLYGRIQSFVVVWGFVTLLHVFSDESRNHSLLERVQYLLSMFAISI
jgi:D-alanyl-lipoteichoic acid acyltransferase DltB (MBOAT superfamily)